MMKIIFLLQETQAFYHILEVVCLWFVMDMTWNSLQAYDCWNLIGFKVPAVLSEIIFHERKIEDGDWVTDGFFSGEQKIDLSSKMSCLFLSGSHVPKFLKVFMTLLRE